MRDGGILYVSGVEADSTCYWIRCKMSKLNKQTNKTVKREGRGKVWAWAGRLGLCSPGGMLGSCCVQGSHQTAAHMRGHHCALGLGLRGTGSRPQSGLQHLNGADSHGKRQEEEEPGSY